MSDFLAEARILVRPDTTRFRAELEAALVTATRGVSAPVQVVPVTAGAGLAQLGTQATQTAAAVNAVAAAEAAGAQATRRAVEAHRESARVLGQVEKAAIANTAGMLGLRGAVLTAGTAFIGATVAFQAFSKSVGLAAQLEEELNVFRVTAQATASEMRNVADAANELGRDITLPGVSAVDAAQALNLLARAGLNVNETIAAGRGVLQFATAAQTDYATAVELTAGALNAFGLQGSEAVRVADVLANAANESQASITDMGLALRQSAAVARQVGLTLEETVTQLTILARAGIVGSDAGTSLRVALTRLVAPTEAAQKALESLNIELRDADNTFRSDVFVQIGNAIRELNATEQAAILFRIFGQDAQRVVSILAREGAPALAETTEALERMGAAAELARARSQGLSGEANALQSNFETLGTTLGKTVVPFLTSVTRGLNLAVGGINSLVASIDDIGGEGFEEANASLAEMVARIESIQDLNATFVAPEVDDLAERVKLLAAEFDRLGANQKVVQAFRQASEEIDAALEDGVISPLEKAQLETEELGRLFLEVAPEGVLRGLGADVRSGIEDATAAARTGVADLGAEIRSGIEDMSREAAIAARQGGEGVGDAFADGLRASATRIQGQIEGVGASILRADIAGDEGAQLTALRQQEMLIRREIEIQEKIIAEGGRGAATARRRLRTELLPQLNSVTNEIESILTGQATRREEAARRAQRASADADQAFLDALETRREDIENSAEALAAQGNVQGAIRLLNQLQVLIKQQIAAILRTVKDEEARAAALRQLRQARNQSQREEAALREQQRREREEHQAEQQERQATIQQLNIDIAIEQENEVKAAAAINARIRTLNKQIAAAKGDQLKVKQLILERERLRNQLEDLNKTEQDNRKSAQQFFFEQLQAQQGFAANLLGNLIPSSATAGLVGVPAPPSAPPAIGVAIGAAAGAAQGRAQTAPTAGQVSTTNDILLRILEQLRSLNRDADAPEARYQRNVGSAAMTGGGGNLEVL